MHISAIYRHEHKMRLFLWRSFHIRSGWKKTPIWNKGPYGVKQETEPQMASPISCSLGVLQGRLATSPLSPLADQYQESGHYTPFESATCTINMLLFFICWLYLIPSLLFPLTEHGGSYSRPNLNHFFVCLELVTIYFVVEVNCFWCTFVWIFVCSPFCVVDLFRCLLPMCMHSEEHIQLFS